MIRTATARRTAGDWAGACAAARVDADLCLRAVARTHGTALAARVRDDLRHLAPDLLRWHMPRSGAEGLLRPGLTVALARYPGGVVLVVRTAPAWADAGQRMSLALWDRGADGPRLHPHPRPDPRFRLDLHRHLWDARRAGELASRCGAESWRAASPVSRCGAESWRAASPVSRCGAESWRAASPVSRCGAESWRAAEPVSRCRAESWPAAAAASIPEGLARVAGCCLPGRGYATHRWAGEASLLLRADGRTGTAVTVRLGGGRRVLLDVTPGARPRVGPGPRRRSGGVPVLPDAAVRVPPDLELLHAGLIDAERLHPLVAAALAPRHPPAAPRVGGRAGAPRVVDCRGRRHRIGLRAGVLTALDHDPDEVRREELLAALGGPMLPCLREIDAAHRHPAELADVRARLDHGDTTGALAAVEALLGPDAVLRDGPLHDELQAAAERRVTHGLYRAGLIPPGPLKIISGRRAALR